MSAVADRLPTLVVARLLGLPDGDVDDLIRLGYATTLLDGVVTAEQLDVAGTAAFELSSDVLEYFRRQPMPPGASLVGI